MKLEKHNIIKMKRLQERLLILKESPILQTKLTPKQTEFILGIKNKNFLAFIGGNKSGKTWCGA